MLHAVYKRKSSIYKRYCGERDGSELKVHEEDEITSTVFGPLEFLSVAESYCFFSSLLYKTGHGDLIPKDIPDKVEFELWARRSVTSPDKNFIEPDGFVIFTFPGGKSLTVLLELKWRAALSGKDQLHQQWQYFLSESERTEALHLFIAPSVTDAVIALQEKSDLPNIWQSNQGCRLAPVSWMTVRAVLEEIASVQKNTSLGRWAQLAELFLEKIGVNNFSGFRHLSITTPPHHADSQNLFWSGI